MPIQRGPGQYLRCLCVFNFNPATYYALNVLFMSIMALWNLHQRTEESIALRYGVTESSP